MTIIQLFQQQLNNEAPTTRKMLALVPMDKLDWNPHPKSMPLGHLARHIAELPSWIEMTIDTNELNFEGMDFKPQPITSSEELTNLFEKSLQQGLDALAKTNEAQLDEIWTLRTGDTIHSAQPKYSVIMMSLSQIIHHRAQLGVYLRLLDIPIPGSYGPSADEPHSM
ncbi:putative damage-inducible protein DinB [Chitinophaga skermanii]|uniref:Putative damage-inducible protein DinB n=1 Tax=Chitinophaga skermanii TaxID=331697 RepID=A0A327QVP3_9BACT|nr:DinB family protein [Chitinophaga skermanii]RAJ08450.1 putative damage-inducible protein DinB [Chitinophaga skermanii]